MKRKIIVLFIFVILLCGCSADVNINISNMKIDEVINVEWYEENYQGELITKELIVPSLRKYVPVFDDYPVIDTAPDEKINGVVYYDRVLKEYLNGYNAKYSHSFSINEYNKAKSFKDSFRSGSISVDDKEKTITISTDKGGNLLIKQYNNYPKLEKIRINLTTTYEVLESNCDYESGNVYTWVFSQDNNNKSIYAVLKYDEKKTEEPNNSTENKKEEENKPVNNNVKPKENKKDDKNGSDKLIIIISLCSIIGLILLVVILNKIEKAKYR